MSVVDLSQITVGTRLPSLTVRFTRETLVRYAGASTDFNPIHYSSFYADQVGLPGVIAPRDADHGDAPCGWSPTGSATRPGCGPTSSGSPSRSWCPTTPTAPSSSSAGWWTAVDDALVTIAIEAVSGDVKVLGAARAVVDCA